MTDENRFIVGIDGGGTKTTAWLSRLTGHANEVIGRATTGSSNIQAVGASAALKNLTAVVSLAFKDAAVQPQRLAALCLGCAGSDRPDPMAAFAKWSTSFVSEKRFVLVNDAELVLAAASEDRCGVALIAGTGSLAWGRNKAGQTARSGGWGYLLGDEGSACSIGQIAVRAALRAIDGRGAETCLTAELCEHFAVSEPTAVVQEIYRSADPRLSFASFAPSVFLAQSQGDVVADSIIQQEAEQLAEMITSVRQRLEFSQTPCLAVTGGILANHLSYQQAVCDQADSMGWLWNEPLTIREPVTGAIRIAAASV